MATILLCNRYVTSYTIIKRTVTYNDITCVISLCTLCDITKIPVRKYEITLDDILVVTCAD